MLSYDRPASSTLTDTSFSLNTSRACSLWEFSSRAPQTLLLIFPDARHGHPSLINFFRLGEASLLNIVVRSAAATADPPVHDAHTKYHCSPRDTGKYLSSSTWSS